MMPGRTESKMFGARSSPPKWIVTEPSVFGLAVTSFTV
jgi:hypothetical protein